MVISCHLNAYDGEANGVEVLYFDQKDLADKVLAQLAKDIGWHDRDPKQRTDLAVLKGTKAPVILIELGFTDNEADMSKWHVGNIANSIVFALTGQRVDGSGNVSITSSKQNVIQSGAFSPYETPDVMGALTSLKMTAKFILQSDGLTYYISDSTSDSQLKACEEWL